MVEEERARAGRVAAVGPSASGSKMARSPAGHEVAAREAMVLAAAQLNRGGVARNVIHPGDPAAAALPGA